VTKAVLDTVILVRGLIDPFSWSGKVLFEHADRYEFVVSPPVIAEYLEVLRRPKIESKFRGTASRDLRSVLDLVGSANVVEITELAPISRDSEDDMFIATARAGTADFIVTQDKDLLVLGEFEGIAFLTAEEFLHHLGATK
jgi:putative PIN family toxin of toxin-antitoxin system